MAFGRAAEPFLARGQGRWPFPKPHARGSGRRTGYGQWEEADGGHVPWRRTVAALGVPRKEQPPLTMARLDTGAVRAGLHGERAGLSTICLCSQAQTTVLLQ